jgi:subtilisin family serine protease
VICISAGNSGAVISYPNSQYIITVGSTSGNIITGWSNRGPAVDVMAPGTTYSLSRAGGYGNFSGTSFSSPLTASLAAYLLSIHESITPYQVRDAILNSADDLGAVGHDPIYSWGRINVFSALNLINVGGYIDTIPPTVKITYPFNGSAVRGRAVIVRAYAYDNKGISKVELFVDGNLQATSTVAPYTTMFNAINLQRGVPAVLQLKATDTSNNIGWSQSITVVRR